MFRKALKIAATFALLVAGYAGYTRGFAFVAARVLPRSTIPRIPADTQLALTARETINLAKRAFGAGHWTTNSDDSVSYYDAERGYWMFFKTYSRLNGGLRIHFEPFALIVRGKKGEALKTIRAKSADIDFDKPFDMGKAGAEPARIVRARLDGDVQLRDDKGTADRPQDDLTVALLYLEYEEKTREIRALESPIALREGQMTLDGFGVLIDLRPPGVRPDGTPATGFAGAKRATVVRDVRIHIADVGDSGIVPASAPKTTKDAKDREPVPGRLFCDGSLVIDFPEPTPKSEDPKAPPPPAKPTFARFIRNVIIEQGDPALPERCDGDQLYLTLMPAEKTGAQPKTTAPDDSTDGDAGTLSSLTLQRAEVTGHAVWLRSLEQGMEGRGNELIFEKHAPQSPDTIYFRGDNYTRVEQTKRFSSGAKKGQIESIDTIRTVDVTIFQGINPGDPDTIIARGPGRMESREAKDKPVNRSAIWGDKLYVQTVGTGAKERRKITLTGTPELDSPTQGNLKARDRIIAYLKSAPKTPGSAAEAAASPLGGGNARIDWMEAIGDVDMITNPAPAKKGETPDGPKTIHAKDRLDVVFLANDREPVATATPLTPAPAEVVPAPKPAPTESDGKPPKGPEPAMHVEADKIYAWVLPAVGKEKASVDKIFLRDNVTLHQDAAEGKLRGTDVSAKNVDLFNRGEGRMYLEAHGADGKPAKAVTDVFMIQGPVIGLDQGQDYAWVDGKGLLYQSGDGNVAKPATPAAVPTVAAVTADADGPAEKKPQSMLKPKPGRGPMQIEWQQGMEFYGKPKDDAGRPLEARAIFRKGVVASTKDSRMWGQEMVAVFDQQIAFARPKRAPDEPKPEEDEPKPQIRLVHATDTVRLVKLDINPVTKAMEGKKQVDGQDVTFNKGDGTFAVDGAGIVRFTGARKEGQGGPLGGGSGPTVSRVADTPTPNRVKPATTASTRDPIPRPGGSTAKAAADPKPPLLALTRIDFDKGMTGRFDDPEINGGLKGRVEADFIGPVRVIHAPVAKLFADLDPDDPPADFYIATSKLLHVVQEPPPSNAPKAPSQVFITAEQDATATTPKHAITGDRITYDSVKDLTYVYGPLSGVSFVNQDGVGQPASFGRGSAFRYNNKTGQREVIDPKNFVMIDPKSATRAKAVDPSTIKDEIAKKKPKRIPFRQTPRNNMERRGFNGR